MSGPVDARRVADEIRLPQSMDRSERLRNEALDEHRQKLEPAELKSQGRRVLDSIAIEFEKLSPKQRENIKELRAQLCLPGDELQRALIKERIREMAPELARKFEELSKLVAQGRKVGEHRHDSDEKRAPRLHIDDGKRPEELIGVLSQLEGRRIAELRSDELLKKVLAPVLKSWREPILEDVVGRERAAVIRMEYARDHFSRAILSRLTGAETENFKAVLADFDRRATGLTAEQRKTTYDQLTRLVLEGNLPATEADRLKVAIQVLRNVDVSGEKAGTNLGSK